MFTLLFLSPRSFFTASWVDMPSVDFPSILMMRSPARMPARHAGVSSMGAMTVSQLFLTPISIPRPWNSPFVCDRNSS